MNWQGGACLEIKPNPTTPAPAGSPPPVSGGGTVDLPDQTPIPPGVEFPSGTGSGSTIPLPGGNFPPGTIPVGSPGPGTPITPPTGGTGGIPTGNPGDFPPTTIPSGTGGSTGAQGYGVTTITASGDDGNVPGNAHDGNSSTRWSDNGVGSWILYDMGGSRLVNEVRIMWYKGDKRANHFIIQCSNTGVVYTNHFSGDSSRDLNLQSYKFTATTARYVKLIVNGNTQSKWASVLEMEIWGPGVSGGGGTPAPPPPLESAYNELETIWNQDYYDTGLCQPV